MENSVRTITPKEIFPQDNNYLPRTIDPWMIASGQLPPRIIAPWVIVPELLLQDNYLKHDCPPDSIHLEIVTKENCLPDDLLPT